MSPPIASAAVLLIMKACSDEDDWRAAVALPLHNRTAPATNADTDAVAITPPAKRNADMAVIDIGGVQMSEAPPYSSVNRIVQPIIPPSIIAKTKIEYLFGITALLEIRASE